MKMGVHSRNVLFSQRKIHIFSFIPFHVIGYSRLGGRLGQCCVEMHYGTVSEDAITSFIGYYKVARENGYERVPCNSPTMQKI